MYFVSGGASMARRIEGVSDQLLRCAREEFMEMGFQEASLRVIAAKAGTSTGSIYTRYGDKDGLFRALTEEAVEGLIESFEAAQSAFDNRPAEAKGDALDYASEQVVEMVNYLYDHLDAFRLLARCSDTDHFDRMIDRLIDIDVKYTLRFLQCTGRSGPDRRTDAAHAFQRLLFRAVRNHPPRPEPGGRHRLRPPAAPFFPHGLGRSTGHGKGLTPFSFEH